MSCPLEINSNVCLETLNEFMLKIIVELYLNAVVCEGGVSLVDISHNYLITKCSSSQ